MDSSICFVIYFIICAPESCSNLILPVTNDIQNLAVLDKNFALHNHISGKEGSTVMIYLSVYAEFNKLLIDT